MMTEDRRMQMQIDLMFEETQELAVEYLDDKQEIELNRRVNPTPGGAPAAAPAPSPAPKAQPAKKAAS